jgi:polyisoprenoid-binding protein YceI
MSLEKNITNHRWQCSSIGSFIEFRLAYYKIGVIRATIKKFAGTMQVGNTLEDQHITVVMETRSIATFNPILDRRLLAGDCLSASEHPYIRFEASGGCQLRSGSVWELTGNLTIRSKTQPITLSVTLSRMEERWGKVAVVFMLAGMFDLKAFGLIPAEDIFGNEVRVEALINMKRPLTQR